MSSFTAAEVRRLAEVYQLEAEHVDMRIAAMLDAFAARLEQDDSFGREAKTMADSAFELGREEGRREILAEIARIDDPVSPKHGWCWFCGAGNPRGDAQHGPNCAWRRAQSVAPGHAVGA